MKQNVVEINFHGCLGEHLKRKTWKYAANTVGQCLNAVEVLSGRKLYKFLYENDAKGIHYKVLINGKELTYDTPLKPDDLEGIRNSSLAMKYNNLKSVDVIPILEGAGKSGSTWAIVAGAVLIVAGIAVIILSGGSLTWLGAALIIGGIGLVAAGVINLLSKGPELQEFKQRQKNSYLFSGPTNTITEGAPVPIGYGRLLIGSAPISASYEIKYFDTGATSKQDANKPNKKL